MSDFPAAERRIDASRPGATGSPFGGGTALISGTPKAPDADPPARPGLMVPDADGTSRPATELEAALMMMQADADLANTLLARTLERVGKAKDIGAGATVQVANMTAVDRLGQLSGSLERMKAFADQLSRFV